MARGTVQEIKERLTIQDIVAPYVKLARAGKSLVAVCPFHKEKTPSFHVSIERGTWHCFGCGEGGDGFSFIEKIEGVDFKGAMRILAEKAGVQIEYNSSSASRVRDSRVERLREVMSRASEWYVGTMKDSPAEAYAKKRNLSGDTIKNWRLGFAPDTWRALLEALTAEGFTIEELLAAGLIKEADGKKGTYYDRFRNRLMFPIRDAAGRVVAFTGRALAADDSAKYLNSPETELYHKSEILFGMDKAKDAIRMRGFTMLVEGQLDVLLAQQIGFENAVALSGTALSEKHLGLMKRYSDNLMLVLDADTAGLSATAKSAALALRQGLRVKAAQLPKDSDPADLISADQNEFSKRIKEAKPVVDFFLAVLAEREHDPHRLLRVAESVVLPLIAAMPSPMEREHFIQNAARVLGLSTEAVRESLKNTHSLMWDAGRPTFDVGRPASLNHVHSARKLRGEQLLAVIQAYSDTPLAEKVKTGYLQITGAQVLPPDILPESILFQVEQTFGENPDRDAADELLHAFEEIVVREAYQEAVAQLRKAEASGSTTAIDEAQALCASLSARLAKLG